MRSDNAPPKGSVFSYAVFAVLLATVGTLAWQRQAITDQLRLIGYTPSPEIVRLADATLMSGSARHLFYVNRPSLEAKADFQKSCPNYGEHTIVIGCYRGGQSGIYVLDVNDERLSGVEEVTSAHEMLHAAYERLGKKERQHIDSLLQDYAKNGLTDERIKKTLKSYETTEPGQSENEMHSIFGTEVEGLPPDLEAYYARYFTSRRNVVQLAQKYQEAFTSRQSAISTYDEQLEAMAADIKVKSQALENQGTAIDRARERLEASRHAGDVAAYNSGVEPFNAKVNTYNALLTETKSLISQYNAIVEKRNAIAAQTLELQKAIDSSNLPQSQ